MWRSRSRSGSSTCSSPVPNADGQVTVDLDGAMVISHPDKQDAAATWKKTFGHHPRMGFVTTASTGPASRWPTVLRFGNAGSNTAADRIITIQLALARLPKTYRRGRRTLVRTDS